MKPGRSILLTLCLALNCCAAPATFTIAGDWVVHVAASEPQPMSGNVHVERPPLVTVRAEKYDRLPVFNPNAAGWVKGTQLRGVQAQETTTPGLLDADKFVLRNSPDSNEGQFQRGKDYEIDTHWGTFGRTTNSAIKPGQPVYATYRHSQLRIDSVVVNRDGRIVLRQGEPRSAAPLPPQLQNGELHLGNIFVPAGITNLTADHLFPILETAYPEPPRQSPMPAERLLPRTMKKLQSGERLRVLAWGDSVTDARYLPNPRRDRWQEQFVARLRERFPKATIELVTEAWGGRNTSSYLKEPPGSAHNYQDTVLGAKPDLIVSEFVNDAGLNPQQVEERYSKLLADFQQIGAEWIILTPHYVRPDWMGLTREREIDNDPRPYVAGLRQFAAKHPVALADAALRYGRLWRQGIPYNSLMLNSINHPDVRGMKLFADALMELFP
jgi:lysophospholipase L1-like esterase